MAATLTAPWFARIQDYTGAWAIEPMAGNALLALARGTDLLAHVAAASPMPLRSGLQVVRAANGKLVGVIPLTGTLMKANSSLGNSTSTVQARRDIRKAADDPEIAGIVLLIDSPGGTVAGTDNLAQDVRDAAKRKPVVAFVEDMCGSAAYWVASQARAVYVNSPTTLVGSIGTVMAVYDLSSAAQKQGVEAVVFATGPIKGAGFPGSVVNGDQRAYFQDLVDSAQLSFDKAVRSGRRLSDAQMKAVRSGGLYGVSEAEAKGLIDGVREYEQAVDEAASGGRRKAAAPASPAAVRHAAEEIFVVAPYGVASRVPMTCDTLTVENGNPVLVRSGGQGPSRRARLQPGCFDRTLKAVADGRHVVRLLAEHDQGRALISSRNGLLALWSDDECLWAAIPRAATEWARAAGLPALSPGFSPVASRPGRDEFGPLVEVTDAILWEVSFVPDSNFAGTGDPIAAANRKAVANFLAAHGR